MVLPKDVWIEFMKRLLIIFLLLPSFSYAQRYAHLFAARAASDSILFSLLGTEEFFARVEPLDKMTVRQIPNNYWITTYEGVHDTVITEPYSATFGYKVYPQGYLYILLDIADGLSASDRIHKQG